MDNINDGLQALALTGTPSSQSSSASNLLDNASSTPSRRPSSATSISAPASEAVMPSRKPTPANETTASNLVPVSPGKLKPSTSEESILDDFTQGRTRALRRQALARKISAQLRSLPSTTSSTTAPSTSSSSRPPSSDDDHTSGSNWVHPDARKKYIDALAAREPEIYTPALAAYFADHPDEIPAREENEATRRRKRYDDYEEITDRYGRVTRVSARQNRLFASWGWEGATASTGPADGSGSRSTRPVGARGVAAREDDTGPMGEHERGEEVRCPHCEHVSRKQEIRRVAKKGLNRLIGRKDKGKKGGEGGGEDPRPKDGDAGTVTVERLSKRGAYGTIRGRR